MSDGDHILTVRDLTVRSRPSLPLSRSKPPALIGNVNLQLERGAVLGVVGASGAGKSTLAKAIVGLSPWAAGSVCFDGIELLSLSARKMRPIRRRIQLVPQNVASLSPYHTVSSILAAPLANFNIERSDWSSRIREAMSQMSLSADLLDRYPGQLSGGQQQRVSMARAFVLNPEVVILDEPVSALDRVVQLSILEDLQRRQIEEGVSCIVITHDLAVADLCSDHIVTIEDGQLLDAARP